MTTPRKTASDKLADLLMDDHGLSSVRLLQALGFLTSEMTETPPALDVSDAPEKLLYWNPAGQNGHLWFERSQATSPLQFNRCQPGRITQETHGRIRVCLFGESTAAGLFFTPFFSPAMALEDYLTQEFGREAVEVIDFSKPGITPSGQLKTARAARQIHADIWVFMTGNNWHFGLGAEPTSSILHRVNLAGQIAGQGISTLAATFLGRLQDRAREMVRTLLDMAVTAGAIPIFAIPPQNHAWERREPMPWLGGGKTASWYAAFEAAQDFLGRCEYEKALAAAQHMARIDCGLSGVSQRIIARAMRALGCQNAAHQAAMHALSAANWHNYAWALPAIPNEVATIIHQETASRGFTCIRLDEILATSTGNPFLDYKVFLDHCHLSAEGIQVCMAAVAEYSIKALGRDQRSWQSLFHSANRPCPDPAVESIAIFRAANWSHTFEARLLEDQENPNVNHLLSAAIDRFVNLPALLTHYVLGKSLACDPFLSSDTARLTERSGAFNHYLQAQRLDAPFLEAICRSIDQHGGDSAPILRHFMEVHRELQNTGLDLAVPAFVERFWERTPVSWDDENGRHGQRLYRAGWRKSHFNFVSDGSNLSVELIGRLPEGFRAHAGVLEVLCNGLTVTSIELRRSWERRVLCLEHTVLREGFNRLTLCWPLLDADEDTLIENAVRRLETGLDADIFPVFGELFCLKIHPEFPHLHNSNEIMKFNPASNRNGA